MLRCRVCRHSRHRSMADLSDRMQRLLKALEIAYKCGNHFMAANIRTAIREQERQERSGSHRL